MSRVHELLTNEVLRTEHRAFVLRFLLTIAAYVGTTFWLNSIRQTAALWFVWVLIVLQCFFFLTIFVVCSLRLRQCGFRHRWWLLFIFLFLSRVENWEIGVIPALGLFMIAFSARNRNVATENQGMLAAGSAPSAGELGPSSDCGVATDARMSQQPETEAELQRMRDEVERLRRDLALLEDPETICSFGQLAFDGDGVEQDYVAAANWFRIAAEQGNARAQHNLALMYESGDGVPQDYSEAAKWYRMAAEQGNHGSQNNLGRLYETGDGVTQDRAIALEWYRLAADGGDTNAPDNFKRLKPRVELEYYQNIVFAFTDLMAASPPLIGDCSLLPHPKGTILYAIKFVVDDYETKREAATDSGLIDSYQRMIPTLNYAFTCLARDWHDITPEDKDAIAKLAGYESFPEWALPLKRKYIDDERASKEAADATLQVLVDKVKREKADEI